jgi:signal peptidase I
MSPLMSPKAFKVLNTSLKVLRIALMVIAALFIVFIVVFLETKGIPAGFTAMEPVFKSGDTVILRKNPTHSSLRRYDIIYYEVPGHEGSNMYGRIVALPGELVTAYRGALFINGEPINEPYQRTVELKDIPEYRVPDDAWFVLLDDRTVKMRVSENGADISPDSREFGAIPFGNIRGKLLVKF